MRLIFLLSFLVSSFANASDIQYSNDSFSADKQNVAHDIEQYKLLIELFKNVPLNSRTSETFSDARHIVENMNFAESKIIGDLTIAKNSIDFPFRRALTKKAAEGARELGTHLLTAHAYLELAEVEKYNYSPILDKINSYFHIAIENTKSRLIDRSMNHLAEMFPLNRELLAANAYLSSGLITTDLNLQNHLLKTAAHFAAVSKEFDLVFNRITFIIKNFKLSWNEKLSFLDVALTAAQKNRDYSKGSEKQRWDDEARRLLSELKRLRGDQRSPYAR